MLTGAAVALVSFALLVLLGVLLPVVAVGLLHWLVWIVLLAVVLVMSVLFAPVMLACRCYDQWRGRRGGASC